MASRIKGITVEIGGDTTGLEKALKTVNSTIKTTQSELRDVTKLLKLDPSNTELLSQKQKALKDAIAATKEKLDALKTAQEQAKQQLENGTLGQDKYDALQREIIETEQELAKLQEQAATTNAALEKIDAVGKTMESVGDTITGAGKKMMGVTTVVGGLGTAAVKTASDFDTSMSNVSAISGATGKDLEDLRDKAREMGSKTKFSASEAADAMGYMAMAGWKTEDMLDGLDGVMNLAAASGEDLATTSDIVTDALTAFGLGAKDSGHFADILAAASSNANTNVSMMGETFKYCAPIAGALGFSAEDTAQAIGLMANAGIKGSSAGTALRTIMSNLAGEVKISGKAIGDVTIATTNADGSMRDLSDILADCRVAFSGLTESEKASAAESLVGKNAMSGFLALMNAGEDDINKLSSAIENCDGTAESMAATMQDNLGGQITILKSALQELAISFGEILMPAIRGIVAKIQEFVEKLNNMDEGTKETIVKIGLLVAAIGPLLIALGSTISTVGKAMQGFSSLGKAALKLSSNFQNGVGIAGKLGTALSGLGAPIGAIIAVIAVLAAAFVTLWNTNEDFRNAIITIWEGIKSKFEAFGQAITDRLNALGFDFTGLVDILKTAWMGFCDLLAPVFEGAFKIVSAVLGTVLDVIVGLLDVFIGLFTGNWDQMWQGVKEIFMGIWEGIKGVFSAKLEMIKSIANTVLGWFGTNWEAVWNTVKTFFEKIWNGITTFFSSVWEGIKTVVSGALETVKTTITNAWTAVTTTFTSVWETLSGIVSSAWETIKNVVQVALMAVGEIISAAIQIITIPFQFIWENCKEIILAAWESIKTTIGNALTAIGTAVSTGWEAVKTVISTVTTAISTAISTAWNAISTTISTVVNTIKTTVTTVWNAIKTALTPILEGIKTGISTAWNAAKTTVTTVVNGIKTTITTVWNAIKTTVTTVVNGIKTTISTVWTSIKTSITTTVNGIKSTISSAFTSIKSTASSMWNSIKTAITTPITNAKNTVSNMIDAIKRKFNFSWSLPHLKLPHLSISGSFSITPPSVPHFSIQWYKKGGIMTSPTIFGMNGSSLMAGGEAGPEAILPLTGFYKQLEALFDKRLGSDNSMMEKYLSIIAANSEKGIYLDGNTLVGKLAPGMNKRLGDLAAEEAYR